MTAGEELMNEILEFYGPMFLSAARKQLGKQMSLGLKASEPDHPVHHEVTVGSMGSTIRFTVEYWPSLDELRLRQIKERKAAKR